MATLAEENDTLGPILVCHACGQDIAKPTREKHFMPFQEKQDNNASCYSLMLYLLMMAYEYLVMLVDTVRCSQISPSLEQVF